MAVEFRTAKNNADAAILVLTELGTLEVSIGS